MLENVYKANSMDRTDQIDTIDQRTEATITEQYAKMNDRVNSTYQVKSDTIQAHMETELTDLDRIRQTLVLNADTTVRKTMKEP